MYKIQIGCNRRLSKIFYIDENAFNSYFGCSSADEFKRTARQEPYACKILSVDKSAEAFSLAFADRVLSRLYIAEYLVADYGSEHKALGIIPHLMDIWTLLTLRALKILIMLSSSIQTISLK